MRNRLTLIFAAIFCFFWAIPGFDSMPFVIDDITAAVGFVVSVKKLFESSSLTTL